MSDIHGTPSRLATPVGPDDHAIGPEDAPVTLVEYGDYRCPDCHAARVVVDEVRSRLRDSLRLVWRHFPLIAVRPDVPNPAELAEAAAGQDLFWRMHHELLTYQGELHGELLRIRARQIGLDVGRMLAETGERHYESRVREHLEGGVRSGVTSTPTFFINGVRYGGRVGPDDLHDALAAML